MSTVRSSLSLLSRLSLLRGYIGKGKIRKVENQQRGKVRQGEKPGTRNSQGTGKVRKRQHQETGKVRKSLRISTVHSSLSLLSRLSLQCGYMERGKVNKGDKSRNQEKSGKGKVRKWEKPGSGKVTNPTFPTFLEFFVTWFLTFELTPPAYGAQFAPQLWTFPDCSSLLS